MSGWFRKGAHSLFLFSLAAIFLLVPSGVAEAAFGISPPFVNPDNLMPGSVYSQTVFLVQDQPNEDLKIQAELEINERARKWITINDGKEIIILKGTRQFGVPIVIRVPKDAGLGAYSGNLRFVAVPAQTGQVTIALGVQVAINLSVGNNIYRKFEVPLIRFLDIEEGWGPKVYLKADNQGNVPEIFNRATYELFDKYGATRLAYLQKEGDFEEVPPFTVAEQIIDFPLDLHLGLGQYWGSVSFVQEGKVIATQRTIFNVLKKGSLSRPGAALIKSIKDNWPYYLSGAILAVFGWIFRRRLPKKFKK